MDYIHFFGTTGNKDIIFKNIRSAGGLYINIDDTHIVFDPGINTFYKYIHTYGNKKRIDGIIVSHVHIDHANDLNIFIELMTNGGREKRGSVIVPKQAIDNKILQPYLENFPEKIETIEANRTYKIKNLEITASIPHDHGVECYGFTIKTSKNKIGIVTDTKYFSELLNSYKDCDILIMNVAYHINNKEKAKHLDIPAVEEFIKIIQPIKLVITHFNRHILSENPTEIAKELSKKYNIEVIAAEDDMDLYL